MKLALTPASYTHYHCVRIFFWGGGEVEDAGEGVEPIPQKTILHRLLYTDKKENKKFSQYIRKFKVEQLQNHI